MNCQTFENVVLDLARSLPLDASVREAALAHSDGCTSCTRRLAEQKLLTSGLQALANDTKRAIAPERLEQNLVSVFREQGSGSQPQLANSSWRYLAVAAAILIAAALGIAGYRMKQGPAFDSQARITPATESREPIVSTPTVKPSAEISTVTRQTPVMARKQRPRKVRRDVAAQSTFVTVVVGAVTDPETAEVVSPFMAVGYTNPANIQDGAQVVRVELPRYAMARFGLPVNMERYDEHVKADVWLGPDGLARAIRFVQ